jgi:hypothetical protein
MINVVQVSDPLRLVTFLLGLLWRKQSKIEASDTEGKRMKENINLLCFL